MRKCPVCEEDVQDAMRYCEVCGEASASVLKDFVCSSNIQATIIPIWVIIGAISVNALVVGFWLGSMINWGTIRWHVHIH